MVPVNVVNLINFDECDQVQDETVLAASQGGGIDAYGSSGLCDQLPDERRDDLLPPALPIQPSSPRLSPSSPSTSGGIAALNM